MKRFTAILASLIIASSVLSFTALAEPDSKTGYDPYVEENIQYDANGDPYIMDENGNKTYYTLNYYGYFVPINETSTNEESSEEPRSEPPQESSNESSEESSQESSNESSQESSKKPEQNSNEGSETSTVRKNKTEIPLINHKIPLLKMNISLPNDVYAITRDGNINEETLKIFKMTQKEAVESLRKSNMYLKGSPDDFSYDITVTMTEDKDSKTINNFTELDDKDLIEITNSLTKQESYTSCTQKKYGNVLYLSLNYKSNENETNVVGIQNYTIVNGQKITITLQTRGNEITDKQNEILDAVMKSIEFTEIAPPTVKEDNSKEIQMIQLITIATAAVAGILFITLIIILSKRARRKKLAAESSNNRNSDLKNKPPKTESTKKSKKSSQTSKKIKKDELELLALDKTPISSVEDTQQNLQSANSEIKNNNNESSTIDGKTADYTFTNEDFQLFETEPSIEKVEIYNSEKENKLQNTSIRPQPPKYNPPGSLAFIIADMASQPTSPTKENDIHIKTETITVPNENNPVTSDTNIVDKNKLSVQDDKNDANQDIENPISEQANTEQAIDIIKTEEPPTDIIENNTDENSIEEVSSHDTKESSLKSFLGKIKSVVVPDIDEDAFEPELDNVITTEEEKDASIVSEVKKEKIIKKQETSQSIASNIPKAITPPSTDTVPKVSGSNDGSVSRYEKLFGRNNQSTNDEVPVTAPTTSKNNKVTESRFEALFGVKNESTQAVQNETFSDVNTIDETGNTPKNEPKSYTTDNTFDNGVIFEKPIQSDNENIHDRIPGSHIPKLANTTNETTSQENIPKIQETESRFEKLFGKNTPESVSHTQAQTQHSSGTKDAKKTTVQDNSAVKIEKIHIDSKKDDKKSKRHKK